MRLVGKKRKEILEQKTMLLIYETKNFIVEQISKPHITRADGSHIRICPKVKVLDRTKLSPELAIEFMRLSMVAGEAMAKVLNEKGIDIGRINYQDNGNWSVFDKAGSYFHLHLYGRAKSSKIQKWGEMVSLPERKNESWFFDKMEPLTEEDAEAIKKEMDNIFKQEKYQDKNWHL